MTIADLLGRSAGLLALLGTGIFLGGLTVAFVRVRPGLISASLFLLAAVGPPAMLGLERGNVELIVIGMVAVAGVLLVQEELLAFITGTALMILVALLKIYPAPLFLVPIAVAMRYPAGGARTKRLVIAGAMALAGGVGLLRWSNIGRISRYYPNPATYAFGTRTFLNFIERSGFHAVWGSGAAYYVAVVAVFVLVVWWSVRPSLRVTLPPFGRVVRQLTSTSEGILLLSGILLLAINLFLTSFPYRLLVLSLVLPACARVLQCEGANATTRRPVRSALALVGCIVALGCISTVELNLTGPALGLATDLTMLGSLFALCFAVLLALGLGASDVPADL